MAVVCGAEELSPSVAEADVSHSFAVTYYTKYTHFSETDKCHTNTQNDDNLTIVEHSVIFAYFFKDQENYVFGVLAYFFLRWRY